MGSKVNGGELLDDREDVLDRVGRRGLRDFHSFIIPYGHGDLSSRAFLAVSAAGIIPYFTHRYYIDVLGKNDKIIARENAHQPRTYNSLLEEYTSFYSGHMKWDYPYIIKKYKPDIFVEFYQNYGEHNEYYVLKHGYEMVATPDGFGFIVLKRNPNIIADKLRSVK